MGLTFSSHRVNPGLGSEVVESELLLKYLHQLELLHPWFCLWVFRRLRRHHRGRESR